MFLFNNSGVKNWAENCNFLPAMWFLLSFQQYLSVEAAILHGEAQYACGISYFIDQPTKMNKKIHYFQLNQKILLEKHRFTSGVSNVGGEK